MIEAAEDRDLLALHGLAVKKAGTPADVAAVTGLESDAVTAALDAATGDGRVMSGRGKYILTPVGRSWLDEQYPQRYAALRAAQRYAALRADPRAGAAYDDFEAVNREVLALMTRWQTVAVGGEEVANDHTDAEYDTRILAELGELHERAAPALAAFAELVPRLGVYPELLGAAHARAVAGETDYVSGVRVPSYHTVWFELHEDLLRLLGRAREA